jgi:hypothetical protein
MSESGSNSKQYLPDTFYAVLMTILQSYPEGLDEYQLLQLLREQNYFSFLGKSPALPKDIFQAHFLLFHALYRMQQQLLEQQQAILEIGPLNIQMLPYSREKDAITKPDQLREYYLELGNLEQTTEKDVHELLAAFWRDFIRFDNRAAALAELGLVDPVDDGMIKQTYRRLAMEYHPDRGGNKQRLQAINAAYECLCKTNH